MKQIITALFMVLAFVSYSQRYEIVQEDTLYRLNVIEENLAGEEYTVLGVALDSATTVELIMATIQQDNESYALSQVKAMNQSVKANILRRELGKAFPDVNYNRDNKITDQFQGVWVLRDTDGNRFKLTLKNRRFSDEKKDFDFTVTWLGRNVFVTKGLFGAELDLEFIMIRDGVYSSSLDGKRVFLIKR